MSVDQQKGSTERVLYGFWLSPYMALVAHVLKESNISFRYERVSPYVGGTHTDEHKARNPLGKIPSLEDSNGLVTGFIGKQASNELSLMKPGVHTIEKLGFLWGACVTRQICRFLPPFFPKDSFSFLTNNR